ncbi:MAG: hypothetical protein HDR81_10260 [Bacteroides sp.]|nr:hypothetical protein [Bacteroides sp.]
MKKIIILTLALCLSMPAMLSQAESIREIREQVIKKNGKKFQKAAKQEAKEQAKLGVESAMGGKTLEEQYYEEKVLSAMKTDGFDDEDDADIYIFGYGEYSTDNRGVALKFAKSRAIQDLQEKIEVNIAAELSDNAAVDPGTNSVIQEGLINAKQLIAGQLKNVHTVVQTISPQKGKRGFYEAKVTVYYNRMKAEKIAREAFRRGIKTTDPEVQARLNKLLEKVSANSSASNNASTEE